MAERTGIEPATDGFIRPLLVLKTSRDTSPILSFWEIVFNDLSIIVVNIFIDFVKLVTKTRMGKIVFF